MLQSDINVQSSTVLCQAALPTGYAHLATVQLDIIVHHHIAEPTGYTLASKLAGTTDPSDIIVQTGYVSVFT